MGGVRRRSLCEQAAASSRVNGAPSLPRAVFDAHVFPSLLLDASVLARVAQCCRGLQAELSPESEPWRALASKLLAVKPGPGLEEFAPWLSAAGIVRLLLRQPGCELCGAKGIRKIYWPFRLKCCTDCLHASTVSHYDAQLAGLPAAVVGGVPFSETTLRNKWGSYVVRHSLKSDLWSELARSGAAASGTASYAEHVRAVEAARRLAAAKAREASEKARRLKDAEAALRAEAKAAAARGRVETVDAWLAAAGVDAALAARLSQTYAGYAGRSGPSASSVAPRKSHFEAFLLPRIAAEVAAGLERERAL